jgi:hypothetical protein
VVSARIRIIVPFVAYVVLNRAQYLGVPGA